jgi:hypothetical protein
MELGKGIRLRIGRNLLDRKVVKTKRKVWVFKILEW